MGAGAYQRGIPRAFQYCVATAHAYNQGNPPRPFITEFPFFSVNSMSSTTREKLARYRASKAKEEPSQLQEEREDSQKPLKSDSETLREAESGPEVRNVSTSRVGIVGIAFKLGLWFLLWGVSIECGFGVVYVIVSGLFLMGYSLYGSKRARHEPSAYSVFNEGCESIDGTLTAEQFERELRYGPTNVRQ